MALLVNLMGNGHAAGFTSDRSHELWPHMTPDVPVNPGQLRLAPQLAWTPGGPRAALGAAVRKLADSQDTEDGAEWQSPEALEAWERPLPAEHELSPVSRAQRYKAQHRRTQMRRMLAEGEAGDLVIVDSGSGPRVTGIPIDHTFVVRAFEHVVWNELDSEGTWPKPRRAPGQTARLLAPRISQPPSGPWELVITPASPAASDNEFLGAVRDELIALGMARLTGITFVPYHEDLHLGRWRRQAHHLEPGGPAYAFRPGGVVTNGLGDLLGAVNRALRTG
ncbi:hypothetical protein ABZ896_11680 [Streptomyces sp. NPDC047072]|uniref:hypothetical protein n=1 Tax=Streptomyces sp. NPDC047072 TaxID=3154809 RepID=UPI003405E6DB